MGHFRKPGCEKPFGRSGYVQFVPECMKNEIDPNCSPCQEGETNTNPAAVTPPDFNPDFPATRLALERRELVQQSLNRLGIVGHIRIIPSSEQ